MKLLLRLLVSAHLCGVFVGCTTATWRGDDDRQEELLQAAGFSQKPATTPAQIAHLNSLPLRKLGTLQTDNRRFYFYADPEFCRCLYLGDANSYRAYRQLAIQRSLDYTLTEAAPSTPQARAQWDIWLTR